MKVKRKIVQLLPPVTGQGKNGPWKKQEFILETQAQFPKKVCVSIWGDKADLYQSQLEIGSVVTASIEVESREYNSRWYTDVRAWKIAKDDETPPPPAPQDYPPGGEDKATDGLPF